MLAWMLYVVVVTVLLGLAALCAERSAQIRKASTRWLWGVAIIASLALPIAISSVSIQIPRMTSAMISQAAPQAAVPLRELTSTALAPSTWLAATAGPLPASAKLDALIGGLWIAASTLLFLAILLNGALLYRSKRGWDLSIVAGQEVHVSEDVGPAVVGLLRPRIVVPRWLLTAPADTQALVIAHERSHLEADDARLLAIAILLILTMPWNLALWWQLRRLRCAIEIDCDARVLRGGGDLSRYGETLIMVGERHCANFAVVAAMSESKSFLEQRLRKMLSKQKKFAWASATALAALGFVLAAGAAEVAPPNANQGEIHQITLDPKVLDGYVGHYSLANTQVLTVTRSGDQLSAQLTGQPSVPVYPRAKTEFFYKVVKAEISFQAGPDGRATGLVLRQNGADIAMPRITETAAREIEGKLQARVKAQTPSPGSEAAVRKMIQWTVSGKPDDAAMSPGLAKAMREQLPTLQPMLAKLGAVQSVTFLGVGPGGNDVYDVRQERGITHWNIALDAQGKIATAFVQPGP
jgi:bla regulator protein BlaR1